MQTLQRLSVAIRVALLVARFGWTKESVATDVQPGIRDNVHILAVDLAFMERIFSAPDTFLDAHGCLNIIIADCSLLAAPALLYFFKRRGFSRCRAWQEPTGVGFSASR